MSGKTDSHKHLNIMQHQQSILTVTRHPQPWHSRSIGIQEFFDRFQSLLLQTWQETGFGHLKIDSERINQNKIRVILRGSTHYRYVIGDEDVRMWISK